MRATKGSPHHVLTPISLPHQICGSHGDTSGGFESGRSPLRRILDPFLHLVPMSPEDVFASSLR
ncbi:hypothetical protein PsorP6_003820 [Peronosclerospora sorghi]|uniref:Uncharacterized protein n=1 Tax=Peronosclerospora sorghi TaxID=230839 RepID=A0ACC0VJF3_9STRA|nr:hypothetical protein PsorP6_003820 [Peronosclerospora sorghi]